MPIVAVWFVMTMTSMIFPAQAPDDSQYDNYIEKIDNFSLQAFNQKQQLAHFIKAKQYFNFKDEPAVLLMPIVTTYNEAGEKVYIMRSKRAYYLDNGKIRFQGEVKINSDTGPSYKLDAKELLVDTKTNDLSTEKEVVYLDESAQVFAQGMTMSPTTDKMHLLGKTTIKQNSGQTILTRDLFVDQSNVQKRYYSDNDTTYLTVGSKVYAQGIDMNTHTKQTKLLGKVKASQQSGSVIETRNLWIDQSKGKEIYRTEEKVHYVSDVLNIDAIGMRYDVINQKIKFTGGVLAHYE